MEQESLYQNAADSSTAFTEPQGGEAGDTSLRDKGEQAAEGADGNSPQMMKSYRADCLRLGFFLTVTLLIRVLASGLSPLLGRALNGVESESLVYAITLLYSGLCLQIIPSLLAAVMLKYSLKNLCGGFKAPKNTKKALANFPALYGAGMMINIATMGVILLLWKLGIINNGSDISDMMNSTGLNPPNFASSFVLFVLLTVIAPFFEEFIFRGAVLRTLQPYGNGLAIFVSAFCFGIYHGNFQQFFYAFALGICLGYIAVATGSLFCSTVLHALFNSIGGIIMIFVSTDAVQTKSLDPTAMLTDGQHLVMTFYALFMIIVLLTAVFGFASMIGKLSKIRRFSPPKLWGEVSNRKKLAVLMLTATVIIAELLMTDIMSKNYLVEGILNLIGNK
ncbi:MAG: CPBP family intramembrane metalloprotease [Ruminiclostridium sp.]|nr:CPBP family intramembrane metalloprotease [Ruminiclostridium sp.]